MKQSEIQNSVPQTPAHFVRRMDETLERIEHMNANHKPAKRPARTLLIAAIIAVLLAGTAVAVGQALGIFEMMTLKPLEGAEKIIQTNVGQTDGTHGRITIEEAAYSGRGLSLLVHTEARDGYSCQFPGLAELNAEFMYTGWFSDKSIESHDGGTYYMSYTVAGEQPDILEGAITASIVREENERVTVMEELRVPFRLARASTDSAKLVPLNEGEQWQLLSAELTFGELFATFEVRYLCAVNEIDGMGVDIYVLDADGNLLEDGGARGFSEESDDGVIIHGWTKELQSFETIPEKLILQPKVIGEDRRLDPIECAVMLKGT